MLFLAMLTGVWFSVAMVLFLIVCGVLVLTVMIQKPQGGGLSAAFGASSGSGQTAFGTKTGDALTVATILVFVVWLILAVTLNIMSRPSDAGVVVTPAADAPAPSPSAPTTPTPSPAGAGETPAGVTPAVVPPVDPNGPVEQPKPVTPPAETPANAPASNPAPAPTPAPTPAPGEPAPR